MSPLAILLRRAEFENLAGDFEVHWAGPKDLLGDVLCGQGEATPELENHAATSPSSHRVSQHADCIKPACSPHLGAFEKLALLFRTKISDLLPSCRTISLASNISFTQPRAHVYLYHRQILRFG